MFPQGSWKGETKPEAGSHRSRTETSRISMIPSQKFGIDTPPRDTLLADVVPRRVPAHGREHPDRDGDHERDHDRVGRELEGDRELLADEAEHRVAGPDGLAEVAPEREPEPPRVLDGDRDRGARTSAGSPPGPAASASVPAITRAGSPGIMRTPMNTMTVMRKSVISEMTLRWIRNSATMPRRRGRPGAPAGPPDLLRLVPARALDADQPVGHGLVALEVLREGHDVVRVVEVDDVPARAELVDRLAGRAGCAARGR